MDTWSLPKTRPISCNDCPAFHRLHMSSRCCSESLTRRLNVINTTCREKIYTRWCCIDRLSWHRFSECGNGRTPAPNEIVTEKIIYHVHLFYWKQRLRYLAGCSIAF